MKKLFIAASLIIGMIAGAMVLSSFSEPNSEEINSLKQDGVLYDGDAIARNTSSVSIKVFRDSQGDLYAIVYNTCYKCMTRNGTKLYVYNNPNYDPAGSWYDTCFLYYVVIKDDEGDYVKYYFGNRRL